MALSTYQRRRRIILAIILAFTFLALCVVGSAWSEEPHEAIELIGLGAVAVGIAGRVWCTFYIGGRKASEIVSVGPYSISRNPLYLFSSLAAFGIGAAVGSLILGFVFLVGSALAFQIVIRHEEAFLGERFGSAYASYVARVPRFLPNFALFTDERHVTVSLDRIYRTLLDGLMFFAAMPLFETVEWLQGNGVIPVLLRLH